jgi:DNA-binding PadR family transcriptional regulator
MTGDAFAFEGPGQGAWGHRGHRCGPIGWAFTKGKGYGRPSFEDLERFAAMRHMRGGPPGGPMFGGHRGGRGRGRARRGDVRLALLLLLGEEPRNGYQLMQTIEERSDGRWRPSPGSVYPTLSQLEDEGLVRATDGENGKVFEITDAGREHLASRAEEPAPWIQPEEAGGQAFAEIAALVAQIGKAAWQVIQVGDSDQTARASELLTETRKGLYRILAGDHESATEESHDEEPGPSGS